jgi:hypothetical protein
MAYIDRDERDGEREILTSLASNINIYMSVLTAALDITEEHLESISTDELAQAVQNTLPDISEADHQMILDNVDRWKRSRSQKDTAFHHQVSEEFERKLNR